VVHLPSELRALRRPALGKSGRRSFESQSGQREKDEKKNHNKNGDRGGQVGLEKKKVVENVDLLSWRLLSKRSCYVVCLEASELERQIKLGGAINTSNWADDEDHLGVGRCVCLALGNSCFQLLAVLFRDRAHKVLEAVLDGSGGDSSRLLGLLRLLLIKQTRFGVGKAGRFLVMLLVAALLSRLLPLVVTVVVVVVAIRSGLGVMLLSLLTRACNQSTLVSVEHRWAHQNFLHDLAKLTTIHWPLKSCSRVRESLKNRSQLFHTQGLVRSSPPLVMLGILVLQDDALHRLANRASALPCRGAVARSGAA